MESDMPIELLAAKLWSGTRWHYPNAERMVEENKRLRADLAAMQKQRNEAVDALKRIATYDYRGNQSGESQIARHALIAMRKEGGGA